MRTISKEKYLECKAVVEEYEENERLASKYKGKSKCPFCGGTKVTPFLGPYKSQDCKECDSNGMISNRQLFTMGLEDFVEKLSKA